MERYEVAIIGTGFGGLGMAIALQQAGLGPMIMFEKADEVGGCWRDNSYPGAACDVPSHLYSYSFEPKYDWSRKFAPQAEIFGYLQHCADKYDLRRHIRFGTEITEARFDAEAGHWELTCAAGTRYHARTLVAATGQLNRPAYPRLPGLDGFRGHAFHSAHWDHDYDLRGKRVAVIGSGASAVQFVPQIAPQVERLHLFQRSAPYVIPKPDRAYGALEQTLLARLPLLHTFSRGKTYGLYESRVLGFTRLQGVMRVIEASFRRNLQQAIKDPALRQKLTPDYPIGCKRILIANDYYPALARSNVEVVDTGIETLEADAIVSRDGSRREIDALIYATGFQSTDFLAPMAITGRDGLELNQAWRDGAEAYLGISVHGFPNLFMLYGPNTNLGHSSIVYMLESQIRYVRQCLQALKARKLRYLDVRPEVQNAFNARLQRQLAETVWDGGCTSWYKTADGKNTNNWPGFTFSYRRQTRKPDLNAYELCTD